MTTTTHKHYELARRAHYNTSFTPEKRAESFCAGFDADIAALQVAGVPQAKIDRYEALVVRHMQVKSRCLSSMITGPANFPVARAEKANRAEHTASQAATDYYNKILKEAKQEAYYAAHPEARPIMAGDGDALERLRAKLATLEGKHVKMVEVNKLLRKGDNLAVYDLMGTAAGAILCEKRGWWGNGYAPFELTNNRAEINRTKERIAEIEKRKATEAKDLIINGVRVLENTEAMRLQLFFEGKPPADIIALLKKQAFKWSPSSKAWQRQLTNNAIWAFNRNILPVLKGLNP